MKLGFYILSYQSPDPVFLRLLSRLRELPNSDIVIHHDLHQSDFPKDLIQKYDLRLVEKPHRTHWSHLNNVIATFDALTLLYNQPQPPDWYIALTPNCYPLKSAEHILDFFANTCEDYYLDVREVQPNNFPIPLDQWFYEGFHKRIAFYIPFISRKLKFYWRPVKVDRKPGEVPFSKSFRLFWGSNWMMLNRRTLEEAILKANPYQHPLVNFYKKYITGDNQHPCPQEVIIPSLICNTSGIKGDMGNNCRYINWTGVSGWSPNTISMSYWEDLRSTEALWARKFSPGVSDEVMDKIDREILKINF